MPLPRFRIRTLMIAEAVVAIECVIMKQVGNNFSILPTVMDLGSNSAPNGAASR